MWDKVKRFAGEIFAGSKKDSAVTKREDEIQNVMGVKPNIIDPNQEPSFVRSVAPVISKEWGRASYANPLNNTIAINDYKPAKDPYIEAHEAGHLSWEDAGPAKLLGVSGRAVTGLSDNLGNPPLLDAIGGGLLHFDAVEEDRAERLAAKYGPALGGKPENAPYIDSKGRSKYGDYLREQGNSRMIQSIKPIVQPVASAFNVVNQWKTQRKQERLQPQIREAVLNHRRISQISDDITPELLASSKNLSKLEDKYGDGFLDFIDTIQ
jgi:hypothetical protein